MNKSHYERIAQETGEALAGLRASAGTEEAHAEGILCAVRVTGAFYDAFFTELAEKRDAEKQASGHNMVPVSAELALVLERTPTRAKNREALLARQAEVEKQKPDPAPAPTQAGPAGRIPGPAADAMAGTINERSFTAQEKKDLEAKAAAGKPGDKKPDHHKP